VADVHKPFFGQRQERVPYGAGFDPLELVQFGNRWESVTGSELRRPDRCPQFVSGLPPRGSAGSGLRSGMCGQSPAASFLAAHRPVPGHA